DEIDKLGSSWAGSPEAALLEVLDPEQNKTFTDHYLELPFDLSEVRFVCTANTLETLSPPLRDRLEIVELTGYTPDEKVHIAKKHLLPKRTTEHGINASRLSISDAALLAIVRDYTREAGVRELERQIGAIARKVARRVAEGETPKSSIGEARARELLGRKRYHSEARRRTRVPGVATGLAYTPVGGDVLFIEAQAFDGEGKLQITGQLGDVMKESAAAAFSYVRGHLSELAPDLPPDWFKHHDIHIHVPAGAIPKDGPSAGITMATALVSLLSGRHVRDDVAMTGEMTLTGQVLPIGGLKDKALAAQRNGISTIIAPERNEPDTDEIPEHLRKKLTFRFVSEIGAVLDAALEPARASGRGGRRVYGDSMLHASNPR
ncbi:MAG: endopeptidase La, partial [Actinobacteria bacterium]|nr:endopeptidase La [Actinomycetota bacterium]